MTQKFVRAAPSRRATGRPEQFDGDGQQTKRILKAGIEQCARFGFGFAGLAAIGF